MLREGQQAAAGRRRLDSAAGTVLRAHHGEVREGFKGVGSFSDFTASPLISSGPRPNRLQKSLAALCMCVYGTAQLCLMCFSCVLFLADRVQLSPHLTCMHMKKSLFALGISQEHKNSKFIFCAHTSITETSSRLVALHENFTSCDFTCTFSGETVLPAFPGNEHSEVPLPGQANPYDISLSCV